MLDSNCVHTLTGFIGNNKYTDNIVDCLKSVVDTYVIFNTTLGPDLYYCNTLAVTISNHWYH